MGRPAAALSISAEDRLQLESIARSQSLPAALARRAQMISCMAASGDLFRDSKWWSHDAGSFQDPLSTPANPVRGAYGLAHPRCGYA
jgi:hypothetical protein